MTAVYGMQLAKHKSVYGKKGARGYNTSHVTSFFDDDEDELAAAKPTVKSAYKVQKTEARNHVHTLKPVKPRIKRQDTFDVPSSSDDEVTPPTKRVTPLKPRSAVVDDTDTSGVQLFPWEKRRHQTPPNRGTRQRTPEGSPEAQLKHELRQATLSPNGSPRSPRTRPLPSHTSSQVKSPDSGSDLRGAGAAARLAARRKLLESNTPSSADERTKPTRAVPKRSVLASDESDGTPRKRSKPTAEKQAQFDDIVMADVETTVMSRAHQSMRNTSGDADIYEYPGSSEDELQMPKPMMNSPKPAARPARRTKPQTYISRPLHKKGMSVPSLLSEMIATDTDTTEPSTRSPSATPSVKSARHAPTTPPSARIGSPETAVKSAGAMTPRQAQLWDRLLPASSAAPSPSALAMRDLTISGERRKAAPVAAKKLAKSQSDLQRRRPRLVDRLKASAPSSDAEPDDVLTEDADMEDEKPAATHNAKTITKETSTARRPHVSRTQSQSESQSQGQTITGKSNIKTYAHVRSHLEDSIDEIMFGFAGQSTQEVLPPPRTVKNERMSSQKSAFDLDESDDDQAGNSQIRTIHELRAAGSLSRGMWEIEEALEEIRQHGQTQRGRRRSALMELATKLADKAFTARFIGQSCETQLAAECGASPDEVADFIIAAAIALILASDPPDHVVQGLRDQGVATWLAKLLSRGADVSRLARDRKSNMSKASQITLIQFCDMIKSLSTLWDEDKPQAMSARTIALKTLDGITRRLRQTGDKSEILPVESLAHVLESDKAVENLDGIDIALSISLLESLSTATLSLDWSNQMLERIRSTLLRLAGTSSMMRKAQFLMLRLCLNLTNENGRNCALLTGVDDSTVHFLLETIQGGYEQLAMEPDDEKRTVALDLLVLTIGIMINLAEHHDAARNSAVSNPELLGVVLNVFQVGQKHMLDAESVEESISNVTFGYLAVMLANLCQNGAAKAFIADALPGQNLSMLVEAVEEFMRHHEKVDTMNFGGEEGVEVWGAFTEKLRVVLAKLKEVEVPTMDSR